MKKIISLLLTLSMLLSLVSVSTFAAKTDDSKEKLMFFDDFEKDIDDEKWSYTNGTTDDSLHVQKDTAFESKKALFVSGGGIRTNNFEFKGNKTYKVSADFKHIEGATQRIYYRLYDAEGKIVGGNNISTTEKEWTHRELKFLAPEDAVSGYLWITSTAAGSAYIDNVKLVEVTDEKEVIHPPKTKTNVFDIEKLPFVENFDSNNAYFNPYSGINNPSGQEISETYAKSGKRSLRVYCPEKGFNSGVIFNKLPVEEGKMYLLTYDYFRISGGAGAFSVQVRFFDSAGKQLNVVGVKTPVSDEKVWTSYRVFGVAPEGAVSAAIHLVTMSTAADYESYIDNVKFERSDELMREMQFNSPEQVPAVDAELVKPVDGKLVYKQYNDKGDVIGDYSYAGFFKGEYALPESSSIPVAKEISPTGTGDDTKMLQEAIDEVYNESGDNSMKKIVLKAGTYNINRDGIDMRSGIILSGEGQGPTGTILYGKDPSQYTMIRFAGVSQEVLSEPAIIKTSYLPSGGKTFEIDENRIWDYQVGDQIIIYHPSPDTWNEAMGMKGITSATGLDTSWDAGETDFITERTITAIEGNKITVDFGVYIPYNKDLAESYIYKIGKDGRLENAGIENLRIDCTYASDTDEKHVTTLINFEYAQNCFIRDVTGMHFVQNFVASTKGTKQITVQNCSAVEPKSTTSGSRRYNFAVGRYAQQILYTNNYSKEGRHDFVTSYQCTGPVVFSDNQLYGSLNSSEAHGGWSTGLLYDNVYQTDHLATGSFALANRGGFGGGYSHGWAAAGSIMWNCLSNAIMVSKPPVDYQVFAVGIWGFYDESVSKEKKTPSHDNHKLYYKSTMEPVGKESHVATDENTPVLGDAYKESVYGAVNPRSLYKAQLADRITGNINNARPNMPLLIDPLPDLKSETNKVNVKGIYQLGATEVKIYIDDVPYTAKLDTEEQIYTLEKELADGVHKFYATQIIDGIESIKTPDRFVIVKEAKNSNEAYLQSIYPLDKTNHLLSDPRPSFEEYNKSLLASGDKIKVVVDGRKINSDVEPFETNGRVLVPMRAIFEALNAEVSWDEATLTATAKLKDTVVKITENQATSYVNDSPVTLDVPATIVNGRFVVPVRFISESFECKVSWVDEKKLVKVETPDTYLAVINPKWDNASGAERTGDLALDRDYSTRWAGDGKGVKLEGEFVEKAKVYSFNALFSDQEARTYNYEIHLSEDGVNYTKVYEGTTTGSSEGDKITLANPMVAKYFRFVGQGGSNTDWILLYELQFFK